MSEDNIISKLRALPGLASPKTIAALLDVKLSTIYKWTREHKLPSYRLEYSVRLDPRAVAAWLEARAAK